MCEIRSHQWILYCKGIEMEIIRAHFDYMTTDVHKYFIAVYLILLIIDFIATIALFQSTFLG